ARAPPTLRQRVDLRAPPRVGLSPLRRNEPLLLETMECRVERALRDLQDILGDLLDALCDGPSMLRFRGKCLKDQEVERALNEVGRLAHDSGSIPRSSTIIPRRSTIGKAPDASGLWTNSPRCWRRAAEFQT